ncbi:MAG: hypothetical protein QOD53_1439 [Thermoleophilaceae bacterium]|nr:hypothetical protein [Thermoleophilaceae bacterium]
MEARRQTGNEGPLAHGLKPRNPLQGGPKRAVGVCRQPFVVFYSR